MRKRAIVVFLALCFLSGLPLRTDADRSSNQMDKKSQGHLTRYVPDRVFVVFKKQKGVTAQNLVRTYIEENFGLEEIKRYDFIDAHLYRTHWDWQATLNELNRNPLVEFAEPDKIIHLSKLPNDSRFGSLWGLHNLGQSGGTIDADIDAPEAWNVTTGSRSVVVAVIDSGVDYNHADLNPNMWVNPGEIPGNGVDDDGNGFVDDVNGINAIDNDGYPMDVINDPHGTHVAGTIGAAGNNGLGIVGVNWTCSIMALKFIGDDGGGSLSDEVQCIDYAINHGAHVINGSYGDNGTSNIERRAIERAGAAGILCAFAAGNDGEDSDSQPQYPAAYDLDNIIAVADSTHNDRLSYSSNYGRTTVDVAAPGSSILSTIPNNAYDTYDGTSMASPHVAGLAALIRATDNSLTYKDLKDRILDSVDKIPSMAGKLVSGGRINAARALNVQKSYSLTIVAGDGGSTNPAPGQIFYSAVTQVPVTALPDTHFRFLNWSGDFPPGVETTNPLSLTVNANMSVKAHFQRIVYPPSNLQGEKFLNRSLSQAEYINVITWQANPDNVDVHLYRVYMVEDGNMTLVKELGKKAVEYIDRNMEKDKLYRYAVVTVNTGLREGDPAYVNIQ
ncbi:S8 family serine peptidase [Acidobacteriota bacterium]